jgi:hypothetical protein
MKITIPILCNTDFDLSKFDFSFKELQIIDLASEAFETYIRGLQPEFFEQNMMFPREIIKTIHSDFDKKYAVVKTNPKENFNYEDVINVWKLLLIIFPSDLQIEYEITYTYDDNFFQRAYMSKDIRRYTGEYPGNLLISLDENIAEINEFAKTVFDRLKLNNYIGIAIENYITSYSASHEHYTYLTLCIALESTISGNQELLYRIRRTVSVLCGKDTYNCNNIYDNLNKIYSLRSKIIHGEDYKYEKMINYLTPLRAIVSRTIIELLVHNLPTTKELDKKITEIGFGNRNLISENWKHYTLNVMTIVESNWKKIE